MKNKLSFLLMAGLAILLNSCGSSYSLLNSNVYPNKDLKAYKTFSIVPYDQSTLPPSISIYDVENIQRAIANELSIRGYKEEKSGRGDMKVITTLYQRMEVDTKDAIPTWTPVRPRMGATGAMYRSYYDNAQIIESVDKTGVLVVDLVDAKKEEVIWDAAVSSIVYDNYRRIKDTAEINAAVTKLFSKFPQ